MRGRKRDQPKPHHETATFIAPNLIVWRYFSSVLAIHPHFGVDLGTPINDILLSTDYPSGPGTVNFDRYNSKTKRFLVGPVFRVDLVGGFAFEFDALYQRIDYDHFISRTLFNRSFEQTKGDRWQFPLLAQYHAKFQRARPFVEAGLTISRITNASGKISDLSSSPSQSKPSSIIYATTTQAGFVAGGGLELGLWRLHIRPEVRYVRLFSTEAGFAQACCGGTATGPTPIVPDPFQTNPNEASFLLGISF